MYVCLELFFKPSVFCKLYLLNVMLVPYFNILGPHGGGGCTVNGSFIMNDTFFFCFCTNKSSNFSLYIKYFHSIV